MAETDGKPMDDSLAGSFDALRRDFTAWFMAERTLLRARMNSSARRVALAAGLACFGVMIVFVALIVLVNVLVQVLMASLGPITAGLIVGLALLLAAILLISGAIMLLRKPDPLSGHLRTSAKFIWSRFHD
jgi:multisubunit Na+/H+ antiporter MnhG subunit